MPSKVFSVAIVGLDAQIIEVEVDASYLDCFFACDRVNKEERFKYPSRSEGWRRTNVLRVNKMFYTYVFC